MLKLSNRGSGNYPYITARVKARRSSLIPWSEWPRLLARDTNEIARFLQEQQYRDAVDALADEVRGGQLVERATRLQQGRAYRLLYDVSKGEPRNLLQAYLERYDVANLKALLRGIRYGATREDVLGALVPVGTFTEEAWRDAMSQGDLDLTLFEGTEYGKLAAKLADEPQTELEDSLDQLYYERLFEAFHPGVRGGKELVRYLRAELDTVLVRAALRARRAGKDEMPLVDHANIMTRDTVRKVLHASDQEAVSFIDSTPWSHLRDEWEQAVTGQRMSPFVTGLEHWLIEQATGFAHKAPLSFLPIIDYLLRFDVEVRNLRTIALGKDLGLTEDEIRDLLLVVEQ